MPDEKPREWHKCHYCGTVYELRMDRDRCDCIPKRREREERRREAFS